MKFLRRAFSLFNNLGSSQSEGFVSKIVSIFSKISLLPSLMFLVPILIIFVIILAFMGMFSYKLNLIQFVDSNNSNRTNKSSRVGNINYTQEDLEECVSYTASATIAYSYDEFVSHLSGTKFGSIDGFNEYIKDSVDAAGYSTPAGVVAAALALSCGYTKETGYKLFYQYPGMTEKMDGVKSGIYMDCRAFVWWAWRNGGFYWAEGDTIDRSYPFIERVLPNYEKFNYNELNPGDIVLHHNHVMLVVGSYDGGYYMAEEAGSTSGLVVKKRSYDNLAAERYRIADMSSKYFMEEGNKRTDRP